MIAVGAGAWPQFAAHAGEVPGDPPILEQTPEVQVNPVGPVVRQLSHIHPPLQSFGQRPRRLCSGLRLGETRVTALHIHWMSDRGAEFRRCVCWGGC